MMTMTTMMTMMEKDHQGVKHFMLSSFHLPLRLHSFRTWALQSRSIAPIPGDLFDDPRPPFQNASGLSEELAVN